MSQELPTSDAVARAVSGPRAGRGDHAPSVALPTTEAALGERPLAREGPDEPQAPSPTGKIDSEGLNKRARLGVLALAVRLVLLQLAVLGGGIVLRRKLEPADFGAFAIAQFALAFLALFGDAGLGGALIQKKEEPTQRQLSSVWFFQIALSLGIVTIMFVAAPLLVKFWPDMQPARGIWLFRALSFGLFLASLRVIPAILMERNLEFGKLAFLEVALSVAFFGTAVAFAYLGLGAMSLAVAVVVQGAVGVVTAFALKPWRPALVFEREALRPILRFGITYQAKNLVGFLTGAITPVYGGRALGQAGLGFLNWAQETSLFPLRLVELIGRVSFPLYSRLQDDRPAFAAALGRAIHICATGTLLYIAVIFGLGPALVHVIFTDKWMPALPIAYVISAAMSLGFLTPVVATALDALGRPQTTMRLSIFTGVLLVVLVPPLTMKYGTFGFALGIATEMVIMNLVVAYLTRSLIPGIRLARSIVASIVACVLAAATARFVLLSRVSNLPGLALGILAIVTIFVGVVALLDPSTIGDVRAVIRQARSKKADASSTGGAS
jgi:PST family polysaccharide transporter